MFENEFWLLLNSPAIPFRIHNRNGKVRRVGWGWAQPCLGSALPVYSLLYHPLFQSYLFLLSSDYERSEWREAIQKLQKKGKFGAAGALLGLLATPRGDKNVPQDHSLLLSSPHGQHWLRPSEAPVLSQTSRPLS